MEDSTPSKTSHFRNVLGISKAASLLDISKAYKSLVRKWHDDNPPPHNNDDANSKLREINEAYRALSTKKKEEEPISTTNDEELVSSDEPTTSEEPSSSRKDQFEGGFFSRMASRRSKTPTPMDIRSFTSNASRRSATPTRDIFSSFSRNSCPSTPTSLTPTTPQTPATPQSPAPDPLSSLSKFRSCRIAATPIIFSQSRAVRRKPQTVERKLECTLEELCNGGVKTLKITRDAISDEGMLIKEEEILKIKIKPGWKKGTKITFEGKGDERPGTLPADITFVIDEKKHPVFKRNGNDLELGVEVPLLKALTGCTITFPVLGGETMTVSFDNVIYPGFEKVIKGQGMPNSKLQGRRGDLRLKFLVNFPTELSDEQRREVVSILNDCS